MAEGEALLRAYHKERKIVAPAGGAKAENFRNSDAQTGNRDLINRWQSVDDGKIFGVLTAV